MRYKPWGETRHTWTDPTLDTTPAYAMTKYQYTGQFNYEAEFGLYFYNARWYDSQLGRFAQADTIVPGGVQGYDRYAYSNNSPVVYVDPSGHAPSCNGLSSYRCEIRQRRWREARHLGEYAYGEENSPTDAEMREYIQQIGLILEGEWSGAMLSNLWDALNIIGFQFLRILLNGKTAMLYNGGGVQGGCDGDATACYGGVTSKYGPRITFYHTGMENPVINILHEFGHLIDNQWGGMPTRLLKHQTFSFGNFSYGYGSGTYYSLPRNNVGLISGRVGGGRAWQQLEPENYSYYGHEQGEDWADIFANAMVGNIDQSSELGGQMSSFYDQIMLRFFESTTGRKQR